MGRRSLSGETINDRLKAKMKRKNWVTHAFKVERKKRVSNAVRNCLGANHKILTVADRFEPYPEVGQVGGLQDRD